MSSQRSCLLIGNSRWHWATKHGDTWNFLHTNPQPERLQALRGDTLSWAAVGPIPCDIRLTTSNQLHLRDIPLQRLPQWLGIDRALGAWGALIRAKKLGLHSPGLLIADAGTILSLTRITTKGEFQGGQLIPGFQLMLQAMAGGAKQLHHPEHERITPEIFPETTSDAMKRGSLQALIGALTEAQQKSHLPLWLCGGDSSLLYMELKHRGLDVRHHPNLVLEGMIHLQGQINSNPDLSESDQPLLQP